VAWYKVQHPREEENNQGPGVGVDIGVPAAETPFTRFFFFFFRGSSAGLAP
jgi:hypothetical protein